MIPHTVLDEDDDDKSDEDKTKKAEDEKSKGPPSVETELFKARTVLIFGAINDKVAREVTARLLALVNKSHDPIKIIINSPGGHVESGDTIHDMIRFCGAPIFMIGTGWVASAGTHIFMGAPKANRLCLPATRFMIHQPSGGVRGPATDIDIEAREIIKMRTRINQVIAKETGQPFDRVEKDADRNYWMSAEEAKDYGLVSRIISRMDEVTAG